MISTQSSAKFAENTCVISYVDRFLYSASGVREYWIVDPIDEKVLVYRFGKPNITEIYTFDDKITAGIYEDKMSR